LVDRVVDALDDRGEDGSVGDELGLVGVHADGEDLLVLGGVEEASAGATGGVVDDVSALVDLLEADLLALRRIDERFRGRARVLHDDLALGAHRLNAGLVARLELFDQFRFLPAEKTHDLVVWVGVIRLLLGHETGDHAGQVATLLLPEDQAYRVLGLDYGVNDGEVGVWVLGGDLIDRVRHEEPDGEDRSVAAVGELGEVVHVVGRGLGFEGLGLHVEVLLGPLEPGVRRVVEALIPQPPDVEREGRTYLRAPTAASSTARAAAAGYNNERQDHGQRDETRSCTHGTSSFLKTAPHPSPQAADTS
jgi:hypothetical protein